jgi:RNA polymerase sigma-70 factor (ECF subfamily)
MKGNVEKLEDIYIKYKGVIYAYLFYQTGNRAIAEELCQEVFLRAFKALGSFEGKSSVKTWLHSIAHNLYVTWYKREIKYTMVPLDNEDLNLLRSNDGQPERAMEISESNKEIMKMLNSLKEEYRNVLILSELQELSYEEIGNTLKWNFSKVKSTLYRARIQVRLKYQKAGGNYDM